MFDPSPFGEHAMSSTNDDDLIRRLESMGREAAGRGAPPPKCAGNDNVSLARNSVIERGHADARRSSEDSGKKPK